MEINNQLVSSSTIASSSIRKVAITLLVTVFGLAFNDKTFIFTSIYLKIAIILLFLYFALDMLQYILIVKNEKDDVSNEIPYYLFILKFFPAFLGLIFILLEILL